ncbi:cadherin-like domain-containing protein [Microcoleus sp. FACHB-53]|nr:cadherin-like domain-containing protein [Microcoleus sp. FACHB-53]
MATFKWIGSGATNNWTEAANWSLVSGTGSDPDGIPDADDVALFDGTSTKNATINTNFSIQNLQVAAAYTGSISLGSNTLAVAGGFAIANASSFDSGTGTVRFTGNQTVDTTAALYNLEVAIASGNLTLVKDLVVSNDLTITDVNQIFGSGGSFNIKVSGDVITNDANFNNSNSAIQLVGSTDQSISGTGVLWNLDVAKTGGDVLLTDDLRLRGGTLSGSGLLKNAGGKVVFGEPSIFNEGYVSNFSGSIDDVELKFQSQSNFLLSKDLVVNNDLIITEVQTIAGNGGSFNIKVSGDVITNDANFRNSNSAIQLVGSTDQSISGTGVLWNLDVAKTGGNVLLTDDLRLRGGTLSGSGLLKNAGGKVVFGEPSIFNEGYASNFSGSIDDVELKFGFAGNLTLNKDLIVNNDLIITDVNQIASSGFSIKVAGDVISSDTNGISGTGAITLVGSATNTYTGLGSGTQGNLVIDKVTSTDKALLGSSETFSSIVVNEGIFDVNGKTATAGTTINNGGTLGGSGKVIGNVTVNSGGVLAPGSGIGILNTGSVNFTNGSLFNVELGGTSAGNGVGFYDQLNVTGTVTIGTSAVLNTSLFGGFTPGGGNTFIIVNNDGVDAITGRFNGLAQGATVNLGSGINATISYTAGDGNDIGLSLLNQAPNLTGNATLAAVAEDTTNPNGQTISTVFNGLFSDPDAGASLGGVAVVGNTSNATTQGTWQYSTDGTNWFAVGTVADGATALALSASTVVRFVPVANYNGAPPDLTVRAIDNTYSSGFTSGGTRINVNTGTNGGTTAISGTTNTINTSITAVNDAPIGSPIATLATGTEDIPYTISKADLLAGFSDVDGDSLSLSNVTVNGTVLTADSSGNYIFTPAANFKGTVNVSYNVVDGKGGSLAATQSFAIAPVNDAPVLATNTLSITEGGTVTLSSSNLNTSDSDNTPAQLLYTISNISGGSFGGTGVTTNGNGTVSFTQEAINNGVVQFTHDGGENPPSYAVSVSDGALNTNPATVTIPSGGFTPVNDAPTGTPTATLAAGTEDTVYTISQTALLQGFTDVEGNTLSVADLTASNGTLVNNNNGTYTFTPAANFNGTVNLSYNVVDGNGGSVVATQSFAIAPVNDAPVLATNTLSITEGATVILSPTNLNTTDSDTPATGLTYTVSNVTGGQFETVANPGTAITSFTQDNINNGAVQFVHNGGDAAPSYSVSVSDGALSTPATPVSIGNFTSVNDAPTLATNTLSITEGGTVTLSSSNLNTSDSDNTPAQLLYTISNISGGSFSGTGVTTNSNGTVSFTQEAINNAVVQFTHDGGENPPSYAVSVSDGALNTNPATVTIPAGSFIPVNDAPIVVGQGIEDQIISINQAFSLNVSNNFSDVDPGNILTYTATGLPSGFSLNANTGIVSGTISTPGIFNVNVTANDGDGGTVSDAFELIVANNNATPFDDIIYMSQLSGIHKDKINAKEGRDRVIGTSANEFIGGAEGDDYLDGQGGNDKLLGGDGNDTLIGGLGSDDLQGGDGNDTLTGWGSGTGSANQIDELKGGSGADLYILGNSTSVFYNLGGYNDYVKIVGFEAEDRIQLKGTASNYSLGSLPSSVSTDNASIGLFTNSGTELIAVLKNEGLTSTSLTTDARFTFV